MQTLGMRLLRIQSLSVWRLIPSNVATSFGVIRRSSRFTGCVSDFIRFTLLTIASDQIARFVNGNTPKGIHQRRVARNYLQALSRRLARLTATPALLALWRSGAVYREIKAFSQSAS
jgi:hypothetical protein